jgi:DNA-binding PadR family transcriptional regulator
MLALGEGPSSGVGLMDRLRRARPGEPTPGAGALYPLLSQLEERGLVQSWIEPARAGVGRPRRFLELTSRGIAELARMRQTLLATVERSAGAPLASQARMRSNLRRAFRVSELARRLREGRERP